MDQAQLQQQAGKLEEARAADLEPPAPLAGYAALETLAPVQPGTAALVNAAAQEADIKAAKKKQKAPSVDYFRLYRCVHVCTSSGMPIGNLELLRRWPLCRHADRLDYLLIACGFAGAVANGEGVRLPTCMRAILPTHVHVCRRCPAPVHPGLRQHPERPGS